MFLATVPIPYLSAAIRVKCGRRKFFFSLFFLSSSHSPSDVTSGGECLAVPVPEEEEEEESEEE